MGDFKDFVNTDDDETDFVDGEGVYLDTKNQDKRIRLTHQRYVMRVDKTHLKPDDKIAKEIYKKAGSFDNR